MGPAGIAAAIRAAQLVSGQPELAERLGEVPVAVLEKGKAPGSQLLSGAVIDPGPLRFTRWLIIFDQAKARRKNCAGEYDPQENWHFASPKSSRLVPMQS